ncbi:MAG: rod-binding protein [Alphaproteobacteria bacterium]|nr:rod-binding protein [Alphaproteobacteria bacterium]
MIGVPVIPPSSSNPATAGGAGPQQVDDQTKAAAKDFEAVFLSQMMSHMFDEVETDTAFGGGQGEEMFRGMLVQEYGKMMAKGNGIGISSQLQKMLIQMQQR